MIETPRPQNEENSAEATGEEFALYLTARLGAPRDPGLSEEDWTAEQRMYASLAADILPTLANKDLRARLEESLRKVHES